MAVILVVDDDEGIRNLVSMLLQSAGYQVVTAANGLEAVAVYRSATSQIDLVVIDFNMPVMDGNQAMLRIRASKPDAKFICMTGNPEADVPDGVICLNKPFSAEELLSSVHELLRPIMMTP
jgi:CheY-like chemotaxis protein